MYNFVKRNLRKRRKPIILFGIRMDDQCTLHHYMDAKNLKDELKFRNVLTQQDINFFMAARKKNLIFLFLKFLVSLLLFLARICFDH